MMALILSVLFTVKPAFALEADCQKYVDKELELIKKMGGVPDPSKTKVNQPENNLYAKIHYGKGWFNGEATADEKAQFEALSPIEKHMQERLPSVGDSTVYYYDKNGKVLLGLFVSHFSPRTVTIVSDSNPSGVAEISLTDCKPTLFDGEAAWSSPINFWDQKEGTYFVKIKSCTHFQEIKDILKDVPDDAKKMTENLCASRGGHMEKSFINKLKLHGQAAISRGT